MGLSFFFHFLFSFFFTDCLCRDICRDPCLLEAPAGSDSLCSHHVIHHVLSFLSLFFFLGVFAELGVLFYAAAARPAGDELATPQVGFIFSTFVPLIPPSHTCCTLFLY